jgi:hypothetical protein
MFTDKRDCVAIGLQLCRARTGVIENRISRVYTCAASATASRITCCHGFDCHGYSPLKYVR